MVEDRSTEATVAERATDTISPDRTTGTTVADSPVRITAAVLVPPGKNLLRKYLKAKYALGNILR